MFWTKIRSNESLNFFEIWNYAHFECQTLMLDSLIIDKTNLQKVSGMMAISARNSVLWLLKCFRHFIEAVKKIKLELWHVIYNYRCKWSDLV